MSLMKTIDTCHNLLCWYFSQGTLRVLLVLLHDFPEFLCDYHFSFCDVIPPNCIQMRNLILSAFPRNMRLPDPFTPNLKVRFLSCSRLHYLDTRDLSRNLFFFSTKAFVTEFLFFHEVPCILLLRLSGTCSSPWWKSLLWTKQRYDLPYIHW